MPKTPCDYSRTVIYKIQHIDNDTLLYIGSTTDFTKRKCAHKNTCNNEKSKKYNGKVYKMIRDNGGWEEFEMIQIEEFPCENKRQAEMEEDKIMREMKATLNSRSPYVTQEEQKEKRRAYKEANKKDIKESKGTKYMCECGSTYRTDNKSRHKKTQKHINFIKQQIIL